MKIYKGETGLDKSYRDPFSPKKKCRICHGHCRIMFVLQESEEDNTEGFIADIHPRSKEKYWPIDAIALAVYCCENCFTINTDFNQA